MSKMYDELLRALRETDFSNGCPCEAEHLCKNKDCVIVQAADAIEKLDMKLHGANAAIAGMQREIERMVIDSANGKPRWISVTDRLPESVCKSYLCLTDTGYHCEVRWTNNVYGLCKSDNNWGWSIADVPQYCKVTHWMPLPQPPKGD